MECTVTFTGHPAQILDAMRTFGMGGGTTAPAPEAQTMIVSVPTEPKTRTRKPAAEPEAKEPEAAAPVANDVPEQKTDAPAPTTSKAITVEDLRAATQAKAQAGHREAVKAIVESFGVKTLSLLKPEQYADFFTKVEAL